MKLNACFITACIFAFVANTSFASSGYFAVNGQLVQYDGMQVNRVGVRSSTGEQVQRVWGAFGSEGVVVTLGPPVLKANGDPSDAEAPQGGRAVLMAPDGSVLKQLAENVLRAFPSPTAYAVALVFEDRTLALWRDDTLATVPLVGKVSHVAWSPDAARLAVVLYPPDWSAQAVNNAKTTADFLRLQQSKIVLLDAVSGNVLSTLVDDGGTNYGPFFTPDGRALYYVHLDLMSERGGLHRLGLSGQPAPPVQVTHAGEGTGQVPLGRVGTYTWLKGGRLLIFEAGKPDGSGVIWKIEPDGQRPMPLTVGRYPQPLGVDKFAVLGPSQTPTVVTIPEGE